MQYQRRAFDDHAPGCAGGRVPGGERRTPGNRWCGRIYGWSVEADSTLEPIGSWGGLPETVAGLAAS